MFAFAGPTTLAHIRHGGGDVASSESKIGNTPSRVQIESANDSVSKVRTVSRHDDGWMNWG